VVRAPSRAPARLLPFTRAAATREAPAVPAAAMFAVVVAAAVAMAPSWAMAWTPEQAPSWADVVTLLTVFQLKVWIRSSCT
jgi:hypothetical protein